jgi:TRAP-type transport system small permease protein
MRRFAALASGRLNGAIEAVVGLMMLLLVLDVWLGVADRYLFRWQLPWPEELARYLMIWAAMLAVSCGIARREHIGLTFLVDAFPASLRRASLVAMDIAALTLFLYVFWYGIDFGLSGFKREAMIFGMSLGPAYMAIPVAAGISTLQMLLVTLRDLGDHGLLGNADDTVEGA